MTEVIDILADFRAFVPERGVSEALRAMVEESGTNDSAARERLAALIYFSAAELSIPGVLAEPLVGWRPGRRSFWPISAPFVVYRVNVRGGLLRNDCSTTNFPDCLPSSGPSLPDITIFSSDVSKLREYLSEPLDQDILARLVLRLESQLVESPYQFVRDWAGLGAVRLQGLLWAGKVAVYGGNRVRPALEAYQDRLGWGEDAG